MINMEHYRTAVIIDVQINYWSGVPKLKPADAGCIPDYLPDLKIGAHCLYPQKIRNKFQHLKSTVMAFLNCNTVPFIREGLRAVYGDEVVDIIVDQLETFKNLYLSEKNNFLVQYPVLQSQLKTTYPSLWTRMRKYYPPLSYVSKKFTFQYKLYDITRVGSLLDTIVLRKFRQSMIYDLMEDYRELRELVCRHLKSRVKEIFEQMATRLQDGRIVCQDTIQKYRDVIDFLETINIFDDFSVSNQVEKIRRLMNGICSPSDREIIASLDKILDKIHTATNIEDLPVHGCAKRRIEL